VYYGVSEFIIIGDNGGGDLHLLIEQYAADLRNSDECVRCDICFDKNRPEDVLLLKIFHNAEAAERHEASEMRRDFEMASTPMIQTRKLQNFSHVG
jgi:quinol monooxygenase YgiN